MMSNIKYSTLNDRERKVFDSVYNGWYMGGKYRALLDDQERLFYADSPSILFRQVDRWLGEREDSQANAHLLVKCVEAL